MAYEQPLVVVNDVLTRIRSRASSEELLALYRNGIIKPHVSQHFPLAHGADAIAALQHRKALGKVVVTM